MGYSPPGLPIRLFMGNHKPPRSSATFSKLTWIAEGEAPTSTSVMSATVQFVPAATLSWIPPWGENNLKAVSAVSSSPNQLTSRRTRWQPHTEHLRRRIPTPVAGSSAGAADPHPASNAAAAAAESTAVVLALFILDPHGLRVPALRPLLG